MLADIFNSISWTLTLSWLWHCVTICAWQYARAFAYALPVARILVNMHMHVRVAWHWTAFWTNGRWVQMGIFKMPCFLRQFGHSSSFWERCILHPPSIHKHQPPFQTWQSPFPPQLLKIKDCQHNEDLQLDCRTNWQERLPATKCNSKFARPSHLQVNQEKLSVANYLSLVNDCADSLRKERQVLTSTSRSKVEIYSPLTIDKSIIHW